MSKKKNKQAENSVNKTYENGVNYDENGSYTGVTKNKNEKPVQDADDL